MNSPGGGGGFGSPSQSQGGKVSRRSTNPGEV